MVNVSIYFQNISDTFVCPSTHFCFVCIFFNSIAKAFFSGSFCQIYRVTDEALIAETAVWPNFFLMNVFFALKGSKRLTII